MTARDISHPGPPDAVPAGCGTADQGDWTHGSRLGREHRSLRQHLVEDHGTDPGWVLLDNDAAVHGKHDGMHRTTWAYAFDLPHSFQSPGQEPS